MSEDTARPPNRLARETSAYLRQHQTNPVDWYPWGDEALALAQKLDKPILLSVGYSACHWCHVMEHESFEDPATAALMNDLYVCIKVDREERPDVDQVYMDVLLRMQGHGGWPMTVFCRPDASPFHTGTYFPPERRGGMPSFREVLTAAEQAYREQRDQVDKTVSAVLESLTMRPPEGDAPMPDVNTLTAGVAAVLQDADPTYGGSKGGPKFPTPGNFELLLAAHDAVPERLAEAGLQHCLHSCREMARRGLYDHLGGGFHRYCVDDHWEIPHFEKMLYDQGLLLRVYAETARRQRLGDGAPEDDLVWPMRETIAFVEREMTGPEGAFHASQDADSEGEEGKFYVWTPDEIGTALGDEAAAFCDAYGVTTGGNFEHGTTHLVDAARKPREMFIRGRATLKAIRDARVPPGTDTKRVASWNGYMISGLARAASVLEDEASLALAARAADFVLSAQRDGEGRVLRVHDGGRSHVTGFLDDYAALVDACLDLHRAGAGDRYLTAARDLALAMHELFFDEREGDLFFTPADAESLVHRPRSDNDGATPQSAGLATLGFLRVAELCGEATLRSAADAVLQQHAFPLSRVPQAFPTLLRAVAHTVCGMSVAVIVGNADDAETRALANVARLGLAPNDHVVVASPGQAPPPALDASWLRGREAIDGRPTAYLCRGTVCSLPLESSDALRQEIQGLQSRGRSRPSPETTGKRTR